MHTEVGEKSLILSRYVCCHVCTFFALWTLRYTFFPLSLMSRSAKSINKSALSAPRYIINRRSPRFVMLAMSDKCPCRAGSLIVGVLPVGSIASRIECREGNTGLVTPMYLCTFTLCFCDDLWVFHVEPLRDFLRILLVCILRWSLGGEPPAFGILAHRLQPYLLFRFLLYTVLYCFSIPECIG